MRDVTRAAMRLFGRLLAIDCELASRVEGWEVAASTENTWLRKATAMLHALDALDVVNGEDFDRELDVLALSDGAVWLAMAERGDLDGTDYVAHVLFHCDAGGYSGTAFHTDLLRTIAAADEQNRAALSLACPEYVGLYRAASEIQGGLARLIAVMDRRA